MRHAPQSAFAAILEFTKLTQLRIATARHQQEKEDYTLCLQLARPLGHSVLRVLRESVLLWPPLSCWCWPCPSMSLAGVSKSKASLCVTCSLRSQYPVRRSAFLGRVTRLSPTPPIRSLCSVAWPWSPFRPRYTPRWAWRIQSLPCGRSSRAPTPRPDCFAAFPARRVRARLRPPYLADIDRIAAGC